MPVTTTIDRAKRTAVIDVRGDVTIANVHPLYDQLRAVGRRRDISTVIVDFEGAERLDSSALAAVALGTRNMKGRKDVQLVHIDERHGRALALVPPSVRATPDADAHEGAVERFGAYLIGVKDSTRDLGILVADLFRQGWMVIKRKKKLPDGSFIAQASRMGVDGLPIVALLGLLLGMTMGFQGVVLLHRFGAGLFVADLIGISMVRELGPMMTAIVITGRTGAALAAELGTMQVRGEIDALQTMGVSPTRYLLLPRLLALSIVQPALSLMATFVGIAGGMFVASVFMDLPPSVFWDRLVERVEMWDFIHGLGKSLVFSWIIGLTGSYLGMRASADASSVGAATTRSVVVSIFLIILVDAIAATLSSIGSGA